MASEQDHYAVLQVHPDAEPEVIAAAYRSLAQMYHPDRNRSPDATRRMAQINIAYDVLSDPARRSAYDRSRQAKASQQARRVERDTAPGATTVIVNSGGNGWGACCGCIVLIGIIVIAATMCGVAVGST